MSDVLLRLDDIVVRFPIRTGVLQRATAHVEAVSGVSLDLAAGKTLGIVGESGCGKTTLARVVAGLTPPQHGKVIFRGIPITLLRGRQARRQRLGIQMIFQDPFSSLNPRKTVRSLVTEAWRIHPALIRPAERNQQLAELLTLVGLNPDNADRYPHQFSGGQRQRIGIARSLAAHPSLLVCDEPVSALDVSIQAQVINLLRDLQRRLDLAYLFISHDLNVVRTVAHRVAVMYMGKIVEIGTSSDLYQRPLHPYTQALLSAAPSLSDAPGRPRVLLSGDVPSNIDPPSGCRFRTRCWKAQPICAEVEPLLEDLGYGHESACHFVAALPEGAGAVNLYPPAGPTRRPIGESGGAL